MTHVKVMYKPQRDKITSVRHLAFWLTMFGFKVRGRFDVRELKSGHLIFKQEQ